MWLILRIDLSHVHTNPDILKPHIFSSGFVWTRRDLKSLGRNFENNAVSVTGLPGFVRKEGYWFRVQKECILINIQIRVDVALIARGFGWLSLRTAYFQVKKDCLRTRLSIGESNIYVKTTSPCQLIFWAIGSIWIKETHKKKSNEFPAIHITTSKLERGLRSTWRILWRKKVPVSKIGSEVCFLPYLRR